MKQVEDSTDFFVSVTIHSGGGLPVLHEQCQDTNYYVGCQEVPVANEALGL